MTDRNKLDYVLLRAAWATEFSVAPLLRECLGAFHQLVPLRLLVEAGISEAELELMLNGRQVVDVEELRAYTIFQVLF